MTDAGSIVKQIKRAISLNLGDKAYHIMISNRTLLSKKNMSRIVRHLYHIRGPVVMHSRTMYRVMMYIHYESPYVFDPSDYCNVAIRRASRWGIYKMVQRLLEDDGVDPGAIDNEALQSACKFGHIEVVRLLLADARVGNHGDALQYAVINNHTNIVRLLLEDGRISVTMISYALDYACQGKHVEIVRLILDDGRANPSNNNSVALQIACDAWAHDVVRILLADERVDPRARDNLYGNASRNGYIEVVRILLEDGRSDPSHLDNYAMLNACKFNNVELVELLLKDKRVMKRDLQQAIDIAVFNEYTQIANLLMEAQKSAV